MIDAVLGYHMNPATCGVAKFNEQLAHHLGVPHRYLWDGHLYTHPLISVKAGELPAPWESLLPSHGDLLLHDRPTRLRTRHGRVLFADEIGCPATIQGTASRGAYRVLTFGMAHKRLLPHFVALRQQLEDEHPDYTVEMSTAIHEGTPWDAGLAQSITDMRAIFGDKLRVLGFLGDDALAKELQDCDAVAVYFDPALRANNTTAWAAVAAGKRLYTNYDAQSPRIMPTWASVLGIVTWTPATPGARATTIP